jgi:hypothetical protein
MAEIAAQVTNDIDCFVKALIFVVVNQIVPWPADRNASEESSGQVSTVKWRICHSLGDYEIVFAM